jgi:hypothetical protein
MTRRAWWLLWALVAACTLSAWLVQLAFAFGQEREWSEGGGPKL